MVKKDSETLEKELKEQKEKNRQLKEKITLQKEEFDKKMDEINSKIELILNSQGQTVEATLESTPLYSPSYDDIVIRPDRYIPVMSLTNTLMILKGNNKFYKFAKYGDIIRIVYADVMDIVHNHNNMAIDGAFYIMDEQVVDVQGLREFYTKVLDKKALDELITKSAKEFEKVFSTLSDTQKKTILNNVVQAMIDGEDISANIVTAVNKACGANVDTMVDEFKNFEKDVREIEIDNK